ncbi:MULTISPECIES: DUF1345 domain-containing protein [unclassified Curtobacterium]|jgi:uncharacterized membrane protein|uniref:DUF1345 domain-containing protein n=1 Tax=unclassified Curtobacterium TaxID=257496 RepID=UPI00285E08C4|nr:DUF1345 domain-containing protein [Curtobacterium sp. SORGH_AS_0776]MDR6170581.1 putative membrane protein [Curtobacterium sp. SORGH_AS_0776]
MSHLSVKACIAVVVGVAVAVIAGLLGVPDLSALLGWSTAALVFLVWAWSTAWPAGPERTRSLARHEDRSRRMVDVLIIVATFLSLVLVVFALFRSQQHDAVGSAAAILAVVGVVAAWAVMNTVYAFKYARMYYIDDRHRFDFDQDEDPSYSDFAYTAFSIGMAYSPGNIVQSSTPSRRIAMGHALLSYFFGTFVVAVAINLITGLTQGG